MRFWRPSISGMNVSSFRIFGLSAFCGFLSKPMDSGKPSLIHRRPSAARRFRAAGQPMRLPK